MTAKTRFHYIDWLRILGMAGIFLYHNARFFNDEDWHVKNPQLTFGASLFVGILNQFIMPLFFVLSAYAIYYALQHRSGTEFMRERARRLMVPFLFGVFTFIPPQVYIERVTNGEFSGSFIQFYPEYFNGFYAFGGNFAWMGLHLWYLLMLFLFSFLALPIFRNANRSTWMKKFLARPAAVYLLFLPLALTELVVNFFPDTIGIRAFGGWSPFSYFMIFVLGYWLATIESVRRTLARFRFLSLTFALASTLLGAYIAVALEGSTYSPFFSILRGFNTWNWMLAFLGLGAHHLEFENGFLRYAGEAVLPFYILHQSVIVVIGFFSLNWQVNPFPKYLLLAFTSFVVIMALYEILVKRIRILRFLFGMK